MEYDPVSRLYITLGEPALRSLVAAFYRRVRQDDLIGPMYPPDDWAGAEQRLADFLIFRFGGPQTYLETRGHPRLRMRHMPFTMTPAHGDRWISLMSAAMDETEVPAGPSRETMHAFFAQVAKMLTSG